MIIAYLSSVDVFEDLFADSSDFAFCWINEDLNNFEADVYNMIKNIEFRHSDVGFISLTFLWFSSKLMCIEHYLTVLATLLWGS